VKDEIAGRHSYAKYNDWDKVGYTMSIAIFLKYFLLGFNAIFLYFNSLTLILFLRLFLGLKKC
jgi:hypothetical protein